jgi:hypothetical protein
MSEIKKCVSFPLDDKGFFRRACPFCQREFKQDFVSFLISF